MTKSNGTLPPTPDEIQAMTPEEVQASLAAFDALKQREADAYRETFHWMLGYLDRDRQVSTAEIAAKMQEVFDGAVSTGRVL
jgi:hypothetical protein